MEYLSEINKAEDNNLRPGQPAFKIGGEAKGVSGEITCGDGEPVFGDELVVTSVGKQLVFNFQRRLKPRPADVKP